MATEKASSHAIGIRRVAACALVLYWLLLLTATHWPREFFREHKFFFSRDKLVHGLAYTILGFLLTLVLGLRRKGAGPLPAGVAGLVLFVALIASISGLLDEATQPLVGRDFEWYDWVADTIGGLCGAIAASFIVVALQARRAAAPVADDADRAA